MNFPTNVSGFTSVGIMYLTLYGGAGMDLHASGTDTDWRAGGHGGTVSGELLVNPGDTISFTQTGMALAGVANGGSAVVCKRGTTPIATAGAGGGAAALSASVGYGEGSFCGGAGGGLVGQNGNAVPCSRLGVDPGEGGTQTTGYANNGAGEPGPTAATGAGGGGWWSGTNGFDFGGEIQNGGGGGGSSYVGGLTTVIENSQGTYTSTTPDAVYTVLYYPTSFSLSGITSPQLLTVKNQTKSFNVTVAPTAYITSDVEVISSNTSVATVSFTLSGTTVSCVVTALKTGTTTITIRSKYNNNIKTTIVFNVNVDNGFYIHNF